MRPHIISVVKILASAHLRTCAFVVPARKIHNIFSGPGVRHRNTHWSSRTPKVPDWLEIAAPPVDDVDLGVEDDEYYYSRSDEPEQAWVETTNTALKELRSNFAGVEVFVSRLLSRYPEVAFVIFVGAGVFVAYMLGMMLLGGYIGDINPLVNGAVPYWEEDL